VLAEQALLSVAQALVLAEQVSMSVSVALDKSTAPLLIWRFSGAVCGSNGKSFGC